jgi:hypothetical protein
MFASHAAHAERRATGTQLNLGLGVRGRACRGTGTSPKGQTRLSALVVTIRPNLEGRNPCGV